jgi:hypothetical protein
MRSEWFSEPGSRLAPEACQGIHDLTFLLFPLLTSPDQGPAVRSVRISTDTWSQISQKQHVPTIPHQLYYIVIPVFHVFYQSVPVFTLYLTAATSRGKQVKSPTTVSGYPCRQPAQGTGYSIAAASSHFIFSQSDRMSAYTAVPLFQWRKTSEHVTTSRSAGDAVLFSIACL